MRPKEKSEEEGAWLGASDTPGQITAWAERKLMCRKVFRCNYTFNAARTSQKTTHGIVFKNRQMQICHSIWPWKFETFTTVFAFCMWSHTMCERNLIRSDIDPVHPQDGWFASRFFAFQVGVI